jgi:hypothetical protein
VTDLELAPGEKSHPLWIRLKAHLQDRLAAARVSNDNPALTEPETAALRGKIAMLKTLIQLGDDRPVIGD